MENGVEIPSASTEKEDFVPDQIDPTLNEDLQQDGGNDEVDGLMIEYFCGIGRWKPRCLQVFRNSYFFTFLICSHILIEGAVATGE